MSFVIGKNYNWKNRHERLVYMGAVVSDGVWHQFAKVETPGKCWFEVRTKDLALFEETVPDNK